MIAALLVAGILTAAMPPTVAGQALPDTVRWSVDISAPVVTPPLPPLHTGDIVVVPLQSGALAAYGLRAGAPLWTTPLAPDQELAADDRHVYVATGGSVHALQRESGETAWVADLGSGATAPPLAHGGWVIAAAGGRLVALRASDGRAVWTVPIGTVEFRPALDGDMLVVPVTDGTLRMLDVVTGQPRWDAVLGSPPVEPLAVAGRVYVGTTGKRLFSLHLATGRRDWVRAVGGIVRGRVAVDDRHIYFAAMDNVLFALDRGNGGVRWRSGLTYRPASGPAVIGGTVVVPAAQVRTLPAFGAAAGARTGEIDFGGLLAVMPVFTTEGTGRMLTLAVVGTIAEGFRVTLLEPALFPRLPLAPLKELPGETIGLDHLNVQAPTPKESRANERDGRRASGPVRADSPRGLEPLAVGVGNW